MATIRQILKNSILVEDILVMVFQQIRYNPYFPVCYAVSGTTNNRLIANNLELA